MSKWAALAWIVYAAGVAIGLWRIDARWPARVGLALVWPLGPIAFIVTVSILLFASTIAFPIVAVIAFAVAMVWLWFRN